MTVAYIVAIVVITILLLSLMRPPKIETWDESIDEARKRLNELKELKESELKEENQNE